MGRRGATDNDEELTPEQKDRMARTGGCIATILVLIFGSACCWAFLTYTDPGETAVAVVELYMAHEGAPVANDQLQWGYKAIAQQGCQLDRQSPRPGDYQQRNNDLDAQYREWVITYQRSYARVQRSGWLDLSEFEDASTVPGTLPGGKLIYC